MSSNTSPRQQPTKDEPGEEAVPAGSGPPAEPTRPEDCGSPAEEPQTAESSPSSADPRPARSGSSAEEPQPAGSGSPAEEPQPAEGASDGSRSVDGGTSAEEAQPAGGGSSSAGPRPAEGAPSAPVASADAPGAAGGAPSRPGRGGRRAVAARTAARRAADLLAAALVLFALLMPTTYTALSAHEFTRIPVEAVFGAALLLVLPGRPRFWAALAAGLGLGVLTVLNLLDMGFNAFLGRGFNVVLDWVLLDDAESYLRDSFGEAGAVGAAVLAVALTVAVLALTALAVLRLSRLMGRHSHAATRTVLVLGTVWVLCAALGLEVAGTPVAARHAAALAQDRIDRVNATLKDEAAFAEEAGKDAFGDTPPERLLTDLRGKDVMITFIESYGRSAIEDPIMSPGVDATLEDKTRELEKAGFAARSGWLTSATYGGSSWLGHSTFLSGLWVDNQQRYRTVTAGDHLTLTKAFQRTGAWRTVGVMPGVQKGWPEASWYGLDHVYDSRDLGYRGPKFSWSTMPDQYALSAFERLEHGRKRDEPLMSEIILTSSHQPWAPIPRTVPWDEVGDGSVYRDIEKAGKDPADVFTDSTAVKAEYGKSIQYSVTSLIDYVVEYGNEDTVLVFLGDHQPLARVSGDHASRDVPCAIVAHDPEVLDRIADWGWSDGLRPDHDAPVWRMDEFRDRFLTAYGSTPGAP